VSCGLRGVAVYSVGTATCKQREMIPGRRIYLDYNAGAPLVPAAHAAMLEAMAAWGNPSSLHGEGRRNRQLVERARSQVATLLGAAREEVVFTSGGTEADHLGILGLARRAVAQGRPRRVVCSRIEHPAIQGAVDHLARERGWERVDLPVDEHGQLRWPPELDAAGLVALAYVNHELGVRQDLAVLAEQCRRLGALCFVDAVQAAGKVTLAPLLAWVDGVAISSHKLGGPKGAGAVWLRHDAAEALPLVEGGHQERGRRPGTESAIAIAGFGAAAAAAELSAWPAVAALGEQLERGLRELPDTRIHGAGAPRIGGTISAGFAGARGESVVMALDLEGFATSTGAACTSGSVQASPVLLALGLPAKDAHQVVRFSLGHGVSAADVDALLRALPPLVERARRHYR
jgi:cysteine desulfurase